MKRVGGRSCQSVSSPGFDNSGSSTSSSQHPVPRHPGSRKIWSTRRLAMCLCISLMIFVLLLYSWVVAPALVTPLHHSFEFKIYEREFGQNESRPRVRRRHGRRILPEHGYDEPLGHPSWILHGPDDGSTASLFYIILELGVLHRPFYVDIDTGSTLTWVHCRLKPDLKSPKQGPNGYYEAVNSDRIILCNDDMCSMADEYRDPANCDHADPDFCQYELHYADNLATRGVLVLDSVGMTVHSQQVNVELAFGCGFQQTGCEYEVGSGKLPSLPCDGILGLSRKAASIPSQLHAKRFIRHLIGHCFLPFHKRRGTQVGVLLFGESDMTTKGFTWARMIEREHILIQAAYEGEMVHVKYGSEVVASFVKDHPKRFVTFDSGTSMTWLTKELFLAVHDRVSAEAKKMGHLALPNTGSGYLAIGGTRCWKMVWVLRLDSLKEMPFRHFKDVTFGFTPHLPKGYKTWLPSFVKKSWPTAKFEIAPSNYLTLNGNDADIICLALFADENFTFQTIGAYALKGLTFVMDNEMHRIGWRESDDCR